MNLGVRPLYNGIPHLSISLYRSRALWIFWLERYSSLNIVHNLSQVEWVWAHIKCMTQTISIWSKHKSWLYIKNENTISIFDKIVFMLKFNIINLYANILMLTLAIVVIFKGENSLYFRIRPTLNRHPSKNV